MALKRNMVYAIIINAFFLFQKKKAAKVK